MIAGLVLFIIAIITVYYGINRVYKSGRIKEELRQNKEITRRVKEIAKFKNSLRDDRHELNRVRDKYKRD